MQSRSLPALLLAVLYHTLVAGGNTLEELAQRVDNTYTSQLAVEAEALSHAPNDRARPVRNGHFVAPLRLRPLVRPELLAVSNSTLALLRLDPQETSRPEFVEIFSGGEAPAAFTPWATPYGLSIYGSEQIADGGVAVAVADAAVSNLFAAVNAEAVRRRPRIGVQRPERFDCLLYTSPSPRDATLSRMPSSA